ncbi:sugar-binding domain-containing protein [Opitutus sp. ER46]|uniref:sugar-binding domain-containing protein n=1 Tax=Opitutus sp. ER46 TaxID=2161864 RepID=UPI000D328244|nr:sugar-binding domain-containing protein [Opitutus sp. ER46]PTX91424.1 glycoside hydrolase [Opitutus sp. ER46]
MATRSPISRLCALSLVALAVILSSCAGPTDVRAPLPPATQSLAGEWRFALDRADAGVAERWFERALDGRIKLPGILQAQGFGDEIRTDTPWVLMLGDAWWKLQPERLRAKFSQPGHVEVPFLSQPPRHYLGAAWYQRDVEVPAAAAGRRFVLFLERPHWETTVWVDDRAYPAQNSLVAPHVTDLGRLAPGKHRLTVRIDNRQIVRDPRFDGHGPDSHSVSDALGATWNGVVGRIELQSTPLVWLEDVQVFPNVRRRSALVRVRVGNATGEPGAGTVTAGEGTVPVQWDRTGGAADIEVALGADASLWDEFHPALHDVRVVLRTPAGEEERTVRFGLREVAWRDKELLVNGRSVNLRTTHFGGDFPLTGYPATDVETWRRMFRVCQDFGLNGMRFHSWCPPEAAFTAADELGFYLQAECGLWAPFNPGSPYTRYLEEETPRLLQAYGNHASFVLFSPSNEPAGKYVEITPAWAARWYEKDPRRLYSAGTGWGRRPQVTDGPQFAALVEFARQDLRNWSGWFGRDYRAALSDVHIPVLAHEIGQWCAYPDFSVIDAFTGYLQPGNFRIFRHLAEQTGVAGFNHDFVQASGAFQLACYKEEIEANLRTPGLAGYQLLDLRDYLGQGTALIGVVDAFWRPKPYVTAETFRRFNATTVPLARLAERTFTTAETLTADVELYHFGAQPLAEARPYWKVVRADEPAAVVAQGEFATRDVPIGKNLPLGRVSVPLASLRAPAAYRLVVGLAGTTVENDWNVWVYPAHIEPTTPAEVLMTSKWAEAEERLAAGGKVLFIPTAADLPRGRSPEMSRTPVFWNIQMTVRPPRNPKPQFDAMLGLLCQPGHPALAGFPTGIGCDWQWTPLIDGVRSVNLTEAPRALRPIVATIDDWNRNWRLGVIFEAQVGGGRLLVCTIDVGAADAPVGARQLRRSLLDYMAGDAFRPAASLTLEDVRALWRPAPEAGEVDQREFDPDLNDGRRRAVPGA